MPCFSIIIPVYNVEPYLAQCLDSVLNQGFADWEALCIDDGSTDGSTALLDAYALRDDRFRVIHQPNGGLSAARNRGMDIAEGDYILFLDSDDWLEPHALQVLHQALRGEDLLGFGGWRGEQEYSPPAATYPTGWDYYNVQALLPHSFPFVCVVLRCYRREYLEKHRLRFLEGILHEDNHFTPRACLAAGRVSTIPDALYRYRLRPGSIMTTRSLRSRMDMLRIANDLAALFASRDNLDRSVVFRTLTHHYQAPFLDATREDDRQLLPLVDWHLYRTVSRTRPRHRLNYLLLRLSPSLYRWANRNGAKRVVPCS